LKAEVFSSDFMVGITVFIIALGVYGIYYDNLQNDVVGYNIRNEMQTKTDTVANLLATSSGMPTGWNSTSVKVIGLRDSEMINLTKFEELKKMDYTTVRNMLGLGSYNLFIVLKNVTGITIRNGSTTYDFGVQNNDNSLQVFYTERYALARLNNTLIKTVMGVVVWQ
jgi:hypothetical protein